MLNEISSHRRVDKMMKKRQPAQKASNNETQSDDMGLVPARLMEHMKPTLREPVVMAKRVEKAERAPTVHFEAGLNPYIPLTGHISIQDSVC